MNKNKLVWEEIPHGMHFFTWLHDSLTLIVSNACILHEDSCARMFGLAIKKLTPSQVTG